MLVWVVGEGWVVEWVAEDEGRKQYLGDQHG